jgi:hypothetical protein
LLYNKKMENIKKESLQPEFFSYDENGNATVKEEVAQKSAGNAEADKTKGNLPIKMKKDDGLDFNCECCGDREGGCAQCGFGRSR